MKRTKGDYPSIPLVHIALSVLLFVPVLAAFYVAEMIRDRAAGRKEMI